MKILIPSSGTEAASEIANYVIRTAKRLGAKVVAVHILAEGESESDGQRCCDVLRAVGEKLEVEVESRIAKGDVVDAIIDSAVESNADIILMGASKGTIVKRWLSADVMERCDIPVLVVPHCYGQ